MKHWEQGKHLTWNSRIEIFTKKQHDRSLFSQTCMSLYYLTRRLSWQVICGQSVDGLLGLKDIDIEKLVGIVNDVSLVNKAG